MTNISFKCKIFMLSEFSETHVPFWQESESESCSVMSNSLQPHGWYSSWNSPGKNTGVGIRSLLQRIFPTQGSNPGLLYCRQILYHLSHQGSQLINLIKSVDKFYCMIPYTVIFYLFHQKQTHSLPEIFNYHKCSESQLKYKRSTEKPW